MDTTAEATIETPEAQIQEGAQATTVTVSAEPQEQEQELLAGKFKTQDDLVKAYKELESMLGQQQPQQQPAEAETTETEQTPAGETETETKAETDGDDPYAAYGEAVGNALKAAEVDPAAAQQEFADNGTLSDETFQKFEQAGFSRDVVEAYLRGVSQSQAEAVEITEAQIGQIKAVAGGDEGYAELTQWMSANLQAEDLQSFHDTLTSGDFSAILAAVTAMNTRRQQAQGTEGTLRSGRSPAAAQGYQTEAEMLEDMRKPEYKTSQAFRDKVAAKIAASSNIMVTR